MRVSSLELPRSSTIARKPEEQLLLCCARNTMEDDVDDRTTSLLKKDLDWPNVITLAARQDMQPLLFWHLNDMHEKAIPPACFNILRTKFEHNTKWNLRVIMELLTILTHLDNEGITALPIKGAASALTLYKHIGLRSSLDLDILVRTDDVADAKKALRTIGYRTDRSARFQCRLTQDGELFVDLQWRNPCIRYPSDETLWDRLTGLSAGAVTVRALSAADALMITCEHGAIHQWSKLKLICDVAELLRQPDDVTWPALFERAHELGRLRMLLLGLQLAADVLGASLPDEVGSFLRSDKTVSSLATRVNNTLFSDSSGVPLLDRASFAVRVREDRLDQLHYVACTLVGKAYKAFK